MKMWCVRGFPQSGDLLFTQCPCGGRDRVQSDCRVEQSMGTWRREKAKVICGINTYGACARGGGRRLMYEATQKTALLVVCF